MSENKVFVNKDNIIEIYVVGDQTTESVQRMGRDADALVTEMKKVGKPALILDDLLLMGKVGPEARNVVVELAKTLDFDRLAMFGKGGLTRFGANLMLQATGRGYKVRFFDDRTKAIAWLNELKPQK